MVDVRTYEEILEGLLEPLEEKFDTGEGTLAYIISSAVATRLAQMYAELALLQDNAYADTARGEYLDRVVALLGMERLGKKNAVVRMEGDMNFSVGDVFASAEYEYEITQKDDTGYLALCKTAGKEPNGYVGEVLPKEVPIEFEGMAIVSIVAPGEEEEDDDNLRERYLERLNCPICMGNLAYYKDVIHSITGVGAIKVLGVDEESDRVKVIITDTEYESANDDLVKYVKNELDPEEYTGQGVGLAPIGHSVDVETVESVNVDIVVEVFPSTMQKGLDRYARSGLEAIFKEMNRDWGKSERTVLRDRVIEDFYLKMGAEDVNVVSINGQANRITLEPNQILGEVIINGA